MKKTKIICSIGPSSNQPDVMEQMVLAGMNVARINFTHVILLMLQLKKENKLVLLYVKLEDVLVRMLQYYGILKDQNSVVEC